MAFLLALAVLAIYYLDPDFLSLLEMKTLDLRFLFRGKIAPAGKTTLITTDEKSLDELGPWPWPRVRIAQLLEALVKYDAKVVVFDIVWAEPDENSEFKGLSAVREKLKELNAENRRLENYLAASLKKADTDRALAESVARSHRAILGYFFHFFAQEGISGNKKGPQDNLPLLSSYNSVKYTSEEAAKVGIFIANYTEVNIPVIAKAAEGVGYFNIFPDRDGTVRWIPLVIQYQDKSYCALSLAVLQKFLENLPLALRIAYTVMGDSVNLGSRLEGLNKVYGTNVIISEVTYDRVREEILARIRLGAGQG